MDISKLHAEAKKQFGLEDNGIVKCIIPTGSILIDRALSIGGFPSGRIIEIYGPEQSGKTTLALHAMAEAQKMNIICMFVDMERAFDPNYAKEIGVQGEANKDFVYETPEFLEQAFEVIEFYIASGIKFVIVDSVSALVPKAELEGNYGEAHMGLQARGMSQALRKITGLIETNDVTLIFINQIRMKIGVMFGSPETTTGGNALKFYASIRIEIRGSGDDIKHKDELIGKYSKVKIKKNKLGPPFKVCQIPIIFGKGIYRAAEMYDELLISGIITKKSSFFYYNDNNIGNGKYAAIQYIKENMSKFEGVLNEFKESKKS